MISVIVSYTVRPDFAEENKKNINIFLDDLKNINSTEFQYNVYLKEDGVTFMHQSTYLNDNIQTVVLNVPSFRKFQRIRDENGGLNGSHKVEVLRLIGTSHELLNQDFSNL